MLEKGTEGRSLKPHTPTPTLWTEELLCRLCMPQQQRTLPAAPEPSKTSSYLSRSTTSCQWLVRQCQQSFSHYVPVIRPSWGPRVLVTTKQQCPLPPLLPVSHHFLIKSSKLKNIRCAWKGLVRSHFLLFSPPPRPTSPVRHSQAPSGALAGGGI